MSVLTVAAGILLWFAASYFLPRWIIRRAALRSPPIVGRVTDMPVVIRWQAIAVNQLRRNPLVQAYVLKKTSEGKSKMGALRCLTRRLCDVIFAILRDQTPYRKPTRIAA